MGDTERTPEPGSTSQNYYAVVKRWDHAVFKLVKDQYQDLQLSQVIWDRRQGERRGTAEQPREVENRQSDRRRRPPSSWRTMGFLVVPGETSPPTAPPPAKG